MRHLLASTLISIGVVLWCYSYATATPAVQLVVLAVCGVCLTLCAAVRSVRLRSLVSRVWPQSCPLRRI